MPNSCAAMPKGAERVGEQFTVALPEDTKSLTVTGEKGEAAALAVSEGGSGDEENMALLRFA